MKKAISRSTFFACHEGYVFPQTEVKVVTLKPVSRVTRCVQRLYYAENFIGTVLIGSFIMISDSVDLKFLTCPWLCHKVNLSYEEVFTRRCVFLM